MKNKLSETTFNTIAAPHDYKVVMPETSIVSATPDVKFIYIMRKDSNSVCKPLAKKIALQYKIPQEQVEESITPIYIRFVDNLSHIIGKNLVSKGKTEIHLFAPESIDVHRFSFIGDRKGISLDPLVQSNDIATIGLSRGYLAGGKIEIGMMPRPGYPSLHEQVSTLKDTITSNDEVDIFEDDIYTGGSLTRIVDMLSNEGIRVKRIIPGIQIGSSQSLISRGIEINPAVRYHIHAGQDIDLGDPRDFLIGADGLVVILNGNQLGRLPYIAPFVSPAARLSIPKENEETFSQEVLALNKEFYMELEEALSLSIEINHMNEPSVFALKTLMPEWENMRMVDIVEDIMSRSQNIKRVCDYHKDHSAIKILDLPKKVAFLDVNGTILPSDSKDGDISAQDLKYFQSAVLNLEKSGMAVGLNSDSPLPELRKFAGKIGIPEAPIIAENGAVLSYKDKKIGLRSFDDIDNLKARIQHFAEEMGLPQAGDMVAPEFGGKDIVQGKWSFGANRTNSISVFADASFIKSVKERIDSLPYTSNISCDYSPEHGFLGIHSGHDFRKGKAETLVKLVQEGHEIVSIGDSLSDYAPLPLPNRVIFVKEGLPSDILDQPHVRITKEKGIAGVIEALKYLTKENIQPEPSRNLSCDI